MTMILSTRRDTFAMLAADQMHGCGKLRFNRHKIVLHSSLPLAFAVGGTMSFAAGQTLGYATEHLQDFAHEIVDSSELSIVDIGDRLRERFQEPIDFTHDSTHVFIALVKDGNADTGVLKLVSIHKTDDWTDLIYDRFYS
jgi:hypothetical protein